MHAKKENGALEEENTLVLDRIISAEIQNDRVTKQALIGERNINFDENDRSESGA